MIAEYLAVVANERLKSMCNRSAMPSVHSGDPKGRPFRSELRTVVNSASEDPARLAGNGGMPAKDADTPAEMAERWKAFSPRSLLDQGINAPMLVVNGADDIHVPQHDTLVFSGRRDTDNTGGERGVQGSGGDCDLASFGTSIPSSRR